MVLVVLPCKAQDETLSAEVLERRRLIDVVDFSDLDALDAELADERGEDASVVSIMWIFLHCRAV